MDPPRQTRAARRPVRPPCSPPACSPPRPPPRRPPPRGRATSTPPAARRASPRTAPPGRCTRAYNGSLYQVRRASDNATANIGVLSAGGYANAAAQDSFCAGTTCVITVIYDQSGRATTSPRRPRRLRRPGRGRLRQPRQRHRGADHRRRPQGVRRLRRPRHRLPQQQHQRHRHRRPARGHVRDLRRHALQRRLLLRLRQRRDQQPRQRQRHTWRPSTSATSRSGATAPATARGSWPTWRTACSPASTPATTPTTRRVNNRFLTADRQGRAEPVGDPRRQRPVRRPVHLLQRRAPQRLRLQPDEQGGRDHPRHRRRQQQRRRRHLLRGRDDLRLPVGRHRERGPGQHRRRRLQHRLAPAPARSPPARRISLRATTACCTTRLHPPRRRRHQGRHLRSSRSSSSATDKADATWIVRAGLANSSCVSFESAQQLRAATCGTTNFQLYLNANDGSSLFAQDATFCPQTGSNGQGNSFQSVNYPDKYLRHYNYTVYIASNGGSNAWDSTTSWTDDTSWLVAQPWG